MNIDEKFEIPEFGAVYYSKNNSLILENGSSVINPEEDFLLLDEKRRREEGVVFTITPNSSCNFKCSYCYVKEKVREFIFEDYKEIVDYIKKSKIDKPINFQISFTGEPIINPETFLKTVFYIKKEFPNSYVLFITNGYNLQLEKFLFLYKSAAPIFRVSYDGEKYQKSNRDKQDIVKNNIKKLVENNFKVELKVTVTEETDIWEVVEECKNLNVWSVRFNILKERDVNIEKIIDNFKKFYEKFYQKVLEGKWGWLSLVRTNDICWKLLNNDKFAYCAINFSTLCFYKDGEIYDCNYSIGHKPPIGNLRNGFDLKTYVDNQFENGLKKYQETIEENCSECKFLKLCGSYMACCEYINKKMFCEIQKLEAEFVLKTVAYILNSKKLEIEYDDDKETDSLIGKLKRLFCGIFGKLDGLKKEVYRF